MGWWNDAQAFIRGNGNLTLGLAGRDDAAYHATYTYAKNDVWIPVGPGRLVSTTLPALTNLAAGQFSRALAASTTHTVEVPLEGVPFRSFTGDSNSSAPHGVLIKSLALFYRVNTTTLTSLSLKIYQVPNAAGSALPTPAEVAGATTGDTLTAAANTYAAVRTATAATWINTADSIVLGEAIIVVPGSSTCDLLGAAWRLGIALY